MTCAQNAYSNKQMKILQNECRGLQLRQIFPRTRDLVVVKRVHGFDVAAKRREKPVYVAVGHLPVGFSEEELLPDFPRQFAFPRAFIARKAAGREIVSPDGLLHNFGGHPRRPHPEYYSPPCKRLRLPTGFAYKERPFRIRFSRAHRYHIGMQFALGRANAFLEILEIFSRSY